MLRRIGFRSAERIDALRRRSALRRQDRRDHAGAHTLKAKSSLFGGADEGRPFGPVSVERDRAPHVRVHRPRASVSKAPTVGLPKHMASSASKPETKSACSPMRHRRRNHDKVLEPLAQADLLDEQSVRTGVHLWAQRPAVIHFLRHFGLNVLRAAGGRVPAPRQQLREKHRHFCHRLGAPNFARASPSDWREIPIASDEKPRPTSAVVHRGACTLLSQVALF